MIANIALSLAFAAFCMAAIDALLIERHKDIEHWLRGLVRLLLGVAFIIALVMLGITGWWTAAGMVLGSGAGFSVVFRWALNAMRQVHPCHLGMGAMYDRFWLKLGRKWFVKPAYGGWLAYIAESLAAALITTYFTLF